MSTRGRKAEAVEIEGALTEAPPIPESIPAEMADQWEAIVGDMVRRKLLAASMLGLVETYVLALFGVRQAQDAFTKHGALVVDEAGTLKRNPAQGLLFRSQAVVTRLGAELGLSPASRGKAMFHKPKERERDLFSLSSELDF